MIHTNSTIIKMAAIAIVVFVVGLIIYFGRGLFIPMSFGFLMAMTTLPVCRWLETKGLPRGLSVAFIIFSVTVFLSAFLWMIGIEMNLLFNLLPVLKNKLALYGSEFSTLVNTDRLRPVNSGDGFISDKLLNGLMSSFKSILSATTTTLVSLILVPIYAVLFLLHRETFYLVLESLVPQQYRPRLKPLLLKSINTYFSFIKGTLIVYLIVGILNSVGLLFLGIENAFIYGMIAAIMTAIPYVGIVMSAALPVAIALATKDSLWYPAGVIIVFSVVQYLEANLIYPKVVGQQLNLSTWAIIVSMITGTLLWGISGMILFVPFAGILKLVSESAPELRFLNLILSRNPPKT